MEELKETSVTKEKLLDANDNTDNDRVSIEKENVTEITECVTNSPEDSANCDESDYTLHMKKCTDALKDASKNDLVSDALNNEQSSDEEFVEAQDIVDSDVEYNDDYLKQLYEKLSDDELQKQKEEAVKLKNEGNAFYKDGNFKEALKVYTGALNKCPLQFSSERAVLYGNRAAVRINLEDSQEAVTDCNKALELNPNYLKVLIRRAQLHRKMDNLEKSLEDYKKILELDRRNGEAVEACMTLPNEINEKNEKLKAEMLGKLKDLGNLVLRPFGLSTDNFNVVQDPNSGGYSINFQR